MTEIDLSNTNLNHADLSNTILSNTNLSYANLSYAYLRDANLSYADLSYADLRDANLEYANFLNANLKNISLYETTVDRCIFSEKVVSVGNIGSRNDTTFYFVDSDIVYCGCWNNGKGGSLEEFEKRVNEVYPEKNIYTIKYRKEYLEVIKFFKVINKEWAENK